LEKLFFAKIKENAVVPSRSSWNAGMDIYPCFDEDFIIIEPGETKLVPTGISSAVAQDYYIQIQERGSSGSKGIKYSAGVIDSSYRGEWFLATTNCGKKPVIIMKKDINEINSPEKEIIEEGFTVYPYNKALFQAVLHRVHNEIETEEISYEQLKNISSERGSGKLGSSGK
jgi:dUTP pyrophosphatase